MKRILYTLVGMMLSIGAWADTLQEQINNAGTTATTITLTENVTGNIVIPAGADITINLGGHKVTNSSGDTFTVTLGGKLTITGEGTVDNVTHGMACIYNNGTCVLNGGTYTRSLENSGSNSYYNILNHGEMTIEGTATVQSSGGFSSLIDNGYYNYGATNERQGYINGVGQAEPSLTINAGSFSGGINTVKNDDNATLTITGGTFENTTQHVILNNNKAAISGGTFTASGAGQSAVWNANYNTAPNIVDATINGGTFNSPVVDCAKAKIAIEGGDFTAGIKTEGTTAISGGTISKLDVAATSTVTISGSPTITETSVAEGGTIVPESPADAAILFQTLLNTVKDGSTIKLSQNITGDHFEVPATSDVVIDLNGMTITGTSTNTSAIQNGGKLKITDSAAGGGIISTKYVGIGNKDNAITVFESGSITAVEGCIITGKSVGSSITVTGGTFTSTDNSVIAGNGSERSGEANTITITGGTFNGRIESAGYVACGIYSPWKDNIIIEGGEFNITNGCGVLARAGNVIITGGTFNTTGSVTGKVGDSRVVVPCAAIVYDSQADYPAMTMESTIAVTGGTFNSEVEPVAIVKDDDSASHIEISGGSYSGQFPAEACAEGFVPKKNPDGSYSVVEGEFVAQIGTMKYASLAEAVAAATDGETVTLLTDINEAIENTNANDITISLNGNTWTSDSYTLKNNGGTITIEGEGSVKSTGAEGIAVWARLGSIVINGGDFENCSNSEATVYVGTSAANIGSSTPSITINGGSFKNTAEGVYKWNSALKPLTLNIHNDIANMDAYQAIVINGGTFYGNDPSIGDDSQLNKINNNSNFVSSDFHAEKDDNGVFVIETGGYVAQVGYLKYVSLDDAIDEASEVSKDVTLISDAETTKVSLPANVTIDANGKELTMPSFIVIDGEPVVYPSITNGKVTRNDTEYAEAYIARKATYIRTNISSTEWGTVCLPFCLTNGNGADYYTYNNISDGILTVDETSSSVSPNTPVVFKKTTTDLEIREDDAIVCYTAPAELKNGALVGTYTDRTITTGLESTYYINGDKFHQAKVSLSVPAYRAYINYPTPGAKPNVLTMAISGIGGTTDGIESVVLNDMTEGIYDINGRQLSAPRKGVNIMKLASGKTVKLITK